MLYLNGGMPRSGTVWVMNVILKLASMTSRKLVKINANTPIEVEQAVLSNRYGIDTLIHFHDVPEIIQHLSKERFVKIFYNFRDPRDIVCSQMRLHDADFEQAVEKTQTAVHHFAEILKSEGVLIIPYRQIIESPRCVVHFIANHMGVMVKEEHLQWIEKETSMDAHREKMERVCRGEGVIHSTNTGIRDVKHDADSFINDRHIQSGKIGRWKDELTPEQQERVTKVFEGIIEKLL